MKSDSKKWYQGSMKCKSYKAESFKLYGKIILTISKERKKCVIDLYYNQGKTTREIAETERMSIRDISPIIKQESFFSLLAYAQTCRYLFNIFCFSKFN
jgi:predicted DNA-binding protein YlxM (UPF0122 family)